MAQQEPPIPSDLHPIEQELLARDREAQGAGTPLGLEQLQGEYERILAERHRRLERDARAAFRAMEGWGAVKTDDDWRRTVERAAADLDSGGFLMDRLGAERYVDPALMAMLLVLRRRLIDEHGAATAAELMLVDGAVLSYYHTLRITGWIGNLAQWLEAEFFRKEGLSVQVQGRSKGGWDVKVRGLRVEEIVERLGQQLLPLLDRSNRMMLRNLKALREQRQGPAPSVSIGRAGQVNVAAQQVNATAGRRAAAPAAGTQLESELAKLDDFGKK